MGGEAGTEGRSQGFGKPGSQYQHVCLCLIPEPPGTWPSMLSCPPDGTNDWGWLSGHVTCAVADALIRPLCLN